jgi:antirestriction protein ArdC
MENTKTTIYETVTNIILSHLEKGTVPWRKTWVDRGMPMNYFTKRGYRGINLILLNLLPYPTNYFVSFKQVKELGGKIRKGEHSHMVIFWKWITPVRDEQVEIEQDLSAYPYIQFHRVWNVAQCDGLQLEAIEPTMNNNEQIRGIDATIDTLPDKPLIQQVEREGYYDHKRDLVNVPEIGYFESSAAYYSVLLHELVHSTGHERRLNRKGITERHHFGSVPYSFEELIAEMGACYLLSHFGIETDGYANNASYIQGWMEKFRKEKYLFIHACVQAQKATDYLLQLKSDER